MGYVDAFDAARQREAAAAEAVNETQAERRADLAERDERAASSMFKDPARLYLDGLVKADLETNGGYQPPAVIREAQEEAWAALEPIIYEVPGRPLSAEAVKDLVAGIRRGPVSEARAWQLIDLVVSTRTRGYSSKAEQMAALATMNAELPEKRPRLNALFHATGAGNSVPLVRELLAESVNRTASNERTAKTGGAFGGRLLAPKSGVAPPPGKLWPLLPKTR